MPFNVTCPSCKLVFGLPDAMAGRPVSCPNCGAGRAASTGPSPIPLMIDPPPVQEPASYEPSYDDDDDDVPVRPRSPIMPLMIALTTALAIAAIVVIVLVANQENEPTQPGHRAVAAERPSRLASEDADASHDVSHSEPDAGRILGIITAWFIVAVVIGIIYLVTWVLMLAWVARDTRARNADGGAMWVLVIFFTGWIGLLVYLASRPHGILVSCDTCSNRRLQASRVCPHCGNA